MRAITDRDDEKIKKLIDQHEDWNFLFSSVFVDCDLYITPLMFFM